MKIPNCDRCLLYAHSSYLVCAVNPGGVTTETCPDFRPDPKTAEPESWPPEGYSWYGGHLIANRPSRYTQEEQLKLGNYEGAIADLDQAIRLSPIPAAYLNRGIRSSGLGRILTAA